MAALRRWRRQASASCEDKAGSTAIEYALIASLVGLALIGALGATGNSVSGSINYVLTEVSAAIGGG